MTLVVFKTQFLLQMLNGDDLNFFQNGWLDQAGNQRMFKTVLYQFCIAINAVETCFWPLSCLK